eukprot:2117824-Rhodomonas_salina.1
MSTWPQGVESAPFELGGHRWQTLVYPVRTPSGTNAHTLWYNCAPLVQMRGTALRYGATECPILTSASQATRRGKNDLSALVGASLSCGQRVNAPR